MKEARKRRLEQASQWKRTYTKEEVRALAMAAKSLDEAKNALEVAEAKKALHLALPAVLEGLRYCDCPEAVMLC